MSSVFKWRVIEPWSTPDGVNVHSPSKSFLSWADMRSPTAETKAARFVRDCRRWGYNAMAIFMNPEDDVEASRAFASYLKQNGLGMIIRRDWTELEGTPSWPGQASTPEHRDVKDLCPYSDATRQYWADRIAADYRQIPDLLGYRMNGTDCVYINGSPWACDCPTCGRRTKPERARDAIRLVAGLLGPRGGTLFWETCQDDPVGQRIEADHFTDLTGEIPDNAFIVIKSFYWDYHPGYPPHPLYDRIKPDADGRSPYMTSIQLAGEYRGVHKLPWFMVHEWSRTLTERVLPTGQSGLWVMAITEYNEWDHPLNKLNWYAVSRFFADPLADPNEICLTWAAETFGPDVADTVVEVVDRITRAARCMLEHRGLWTQLHSRYPTLDYLDSRMCGPVRQSPRRKGMIGQEWPIDMYSEHRREQILADPNVCLAFRKMPFDAGVKADIMARKAEAVFQAGQAAAL